MSPHEILGVAADASEQEIRTAYLSKVKEFPPDQSPEKFEAIRDAYETLRDPRKRAEAMILSTAFMAPLVSFIDNLPANRVFAGPELWREVLKSK